MKCFYTFLLRFDIFISLAVADDEGFIEEVVVVWTCSSDTGVTFITVGHSLWALMKITMHVHNGPKAKVLDYDACCTSLSMFFITIINWYIWDLCL